VADHRRSIRAATFALLLALAGCSSLIPQYSRPSAPVPPTYSAELASATPASGEAAADIEWQRFFTDDRLKRLIGIALTNNRDLRVAILNIEQARASYQVHRAALYPAIGVGASATRQPDAFGHLEQVYAAGLVVSSYEIDLFGRVHDLSEAALAQYLATAEARKAVQISLVASVATTYLSVAADDELLKVTEQTLVTREESTRLTKLRFDNGASSELDYRQAESLLEGARATLAATVRQRALDVNALALLLGQTPPEQPAPVPLADAHMLAAPPAGLPSDLLVRRPDIRSAEQLLLASNANIGAARAAFLPHITLTTSAGTASTQLSGLFKSGSFAITGTVQLLQPIFDFGLNQANLDIAQIDRDIAIAQYEKTIQTAFREVSDALAGRATLGEQLRAQAAQTHALEIAYRLADLRYRSGASSYLDSLEAQRSLFVAQQLLIQAEATQLQNDVALYRALGGGWKDETAETASLTPPP
jgi:outer membrane protein, multidrug efflux system